MSKHSYFAKTALVVGIMVLGLGLASTASAKSGKQPPSINDLIGVWMVQDKGTEYDLVSTDRWKWKDKGTCVVTKLDNETVNLHFDMPGYSWDDVCYYGGNGVLVTGSSDDTDLGSWAYLQMLTISGKAGKLKAKGVWMEYDLGDGWLDVGDISLKQQ